MIDQLKLQPTVSYRNLATFFSLGGVVYERDVHVACCGNVLYNKTTEICCTWKDEGKVHARSNSVSFIYSAENF